ncbi:cag pathogenicity island Cag12 family protein [Enterobacter hormaechei]|uniref:cag pathogenicity island Cag12 family protein n=1 Tax=Enterobacter hormaechei TaxID=158836 RepID=UPI003CF8E212
MKKMLMVSVLFLSACSSPPEPPQIDWKQNPETVNTQLMDWQPTYSVIKSDKINSSWVKVIHDFRPENRLYDDAVFYSVAHSDSVIVETNNGTDFFTAKNWLRANGANGVIHYRYKMNCLSCRTTSVYLSR